MWRLTIGIPTIPRPMPTLDRTLRCALASARSASAGRVRVLVLNASADSRAHRDVARAEAAYRDDVSLGRLRFVADRGRHPALASPNWTQQQTLDAACLLDLVDGDFYVHLEDDGELADGFWTTLEPWIDASCRGRREWSMISLYHTFALADGTEYPEGPVSGALGQLIRGSDARPLASYLRAHVDGAPLDHLMGRFARARGTIYLRSPCLVEHRGTVSSGPDGLRFDHATGFSSRWGSRASALLRDAAGVVRLYGWRGLYRFARGKLRPLRRRVDVGWRHRKARA